MMEGAQLGESKHTLDGAYFWDAISLYRVNFQQPSQQQWPYHLLFPW